MGVVFLEELVEGGGQVGHYCSCLGIAGRTMAECWRSMILLDE